MLHPIFLPRRRSSLARFGRSRILALGVGALLSFGVCRLQGSTTVTGNDPGAAYSNTQSDARADVAQSFTATKTGVLTSIKIFGSTTSSSTLNIYSGDGVGGTLLTSQSVTAFNAAGDADTSFQRYIGSTLTLSSTVNITNGNRYTFQLINNDGVSITYTTNSDYSGGTAYDTGVEIGGSIDFEFSVVQDDPPNSAPVNNVAPAIIGTQTVGFALSTTTGSWSDPDGDTLTYSYQWYRADDSSGTNAAAIGSATSSSYTLTTAEAHKFVRVVVTANDGNGHTATGNSSWTAVNNATPVNSVSPQVSGTAVVGNSLSTTTGSWTDADGDALSYSYQWYRADDNSGTNATAIGSATSSSYTLTVSDGNKYVRAVVTTNDGHGANPGAVSSWNAVYAVPSVSSIVRSGGASATVNASTNSVSYTVTFSESVSGVDATDFSLTATGTASANIASVSGSGTTYTVTADSISGDGTLRLDLNGSGTGIKSGNNVDIATGYTSGQTYTLDHTAPFAPSRPDMTSGTDSGSSNTDNFTSNTTPTFTGTAETNSTVTLYDTDGTTVLGMATAAAGNWSITSSTLSSGAHTLTATATDAAGNTSSASSGLLVRIDNSAPTSLALSKTTVATSAATSASTIGTLSASDSNSPITFTLATGNGTNDADNGSFVISSTSLKVGGSSLSAGTYKIYIAATDPMGNVGYNAFTITIVDAPSVSSIVRAGGAAAAVSASATSISYTVTFDQAVTGVDASDFALTATGTASGSIASVSGSGTTYTITVDTLSGDGTLRLDLNGSGTGIQNGSNIDISAGYSSGATYTFDHTAPGAPSTPDMASATDSGVSNTDNVTSNTTPIFTGTAESGSTVTLYDTDGTTVLGSATATAGNWSITSSTLSEGSHTLTAKATDSAGNVSAASSGLSVTIDTSAPAVTSVAVPSNGVYGANTNLDFTINFSEAVTVDTSGGTPRLALVIGVTSVHANYVSGTGTSALLFRYTVDPGASDADGITVGALSANGGTLRDAVSHDATLTLNSVGSTAAVLVDGNGPSVSLIVRAGSNPTHSASVDYTVTFSKNVSGVSTGDFSVTATGTAAGVVAAVTPVSGSVYTVTVNSVSGDGTLRLDLKSSGTGITDTPGNAISGGFTTGETYTIDSTAPTVNTIQRQSPTAVNVSAASVTWRVTFSEGVSGVDATDFTVTTVAGTANGNISGIAAVDTATYDVTVSSLSGNGQLRLDLKATGTGIADLSSVALADGGFTTGDIYLIGATNVFDAVSLAAGTARSVSGATANKVAQRFTTSASAPLSLTNVAALLGNVSGTPAPKVTIHADDGSNGISAPVIGTLTNPASLTPNALNVWTGSILLSANTSYWIVFDDASSIGAYEIQGTAATAGGSGNWLSNADYLYRFGANAATGPQTGALRIALGASNASTITSSLTANGTYGTPFSYAITATNTPTSFAATGLPSGLTVDTATGQISGTPAQTGTFSVSLSATNAEGTGQASTLTLTITKAPLTVTASSQSRAYNTANPALTVAYSGFVGGDSASSLTTQPTATTSATSNSSVGTYAITASGGVSSNYAFTYVDGVLTVTQATAAVSLSGLTNAYTGSPQAATVSTTPVDLAVTVTYDGSATAPSEPGSYAVVATVNDTNYQGTASGTLTIAKAPVSISLSGLTATYDGSAKAVTATTSPSALPVSLTYAGSTTAPTNAGTYTVVATVDTASQSGSATATLTIGKASQVITFDAPSGLDTGSAPFVLSASASSGLPVTFTVVSGPATVSGNTTTLTGAPGDVTVTAAQAGDNNHFAAADVSRTFTVISAGPRVFIGDVLTSAGANKAGDLAAVIPPTGSTGNLVVIVPGLGIDIATDFTLGADGRFVKDVTGHNLAAVAAAAAKGAAIAADEPPLTLRGQLVGNVLSGRFDELDLAFSVLVQGRGPTSNYAGFYQSTVVNSDSDTIYTIIGNNAEVITLAKISNTVIADRGTLDGLGFNIAQNNVTLSGSVNPSTATVAGKVSQPGVADITFSAFPATDVRSDRLINLSSRARVRGNGDGALISGFIIGGTEPKRVLLRAIGPTLTKFGITDALDNPRLRLFDASGHVLLENDDWGGKETADTMAQIGAFALPSGSHDAAIVTTLNPGAYTMLVIDGGQTGTVLAEVYDASAQNAGEFQRLINISSRGMVDSNGGPLIGGFIIAGNSPKKVLIRAAGPALAPYGVAGFLADPKLKVYDGDGTVVAQNDDWGTPATVQAGQTAASASAISATTQAIGAFAFAPASKDAALVVTLAPGAHTAVVSGLPGASGVALIEIYEVP
ncbi:MAG TPA: MBG domain-containing protein [Opitutaceae bacterium]|nr:MBG domain-containing protein [Opitutaceae bacterium]